MKKELRMNKKMKKKRNEKLLILEFIKVVFPKTFKVIKNRIEQDNKLKHIN